MAELILEENLEKKKIEVLKKLFESWNLSLNIKKNGEKNAEKKTSIFDGIGMWENYDIDAKELRRKAWERNK